jgi:phospholipid/cholesterol/gamma-HCH transport system ATP-binding protein
MKKLIIKVSNLVGGYGDHHILEDISFNVYDGDITVILGGSGSGKTTLLKNILNLLKPLDGSIELYTNNEEEVPWRDIKRDIGVLFQNGALLNSLTVAENIAIPLEQHTEFSKEIIDHIIDLKLHLVNLPDAADYFPTELSGGMKKRVSLARALALDPKLLFADEPSAGLDPFTSKSLDNLLLSLREKLGMSMVVVSHEVASIKRIADRVIYLKDGGILFKGTLKEALSSDIEELENFFM